MRYLVDECLGLLIVTKLKDLGHDVVWVRDVAKGTPDEKVLEWSVRDERVLLTEDFDYGDLIFCEGSGSLWGRDTAAFGLFRSLGAGCL